MPSLFGKKERTSGSIRTTLGSESGLEEGSIWYDINHSKAERAQLPPIKLVRKRRWRIVEFIAYFLVFTWVVGIMAAISSGLYKYTTPKVDTTLDDCNIDPNSIVARYFAINIRVFQNLDFSSAKLIDLAWDVLVGQGGRMLHAWLFYHVAMRAYTYILEHSVAPYYFIMDMSFSPLSLSSLWSSIKITVKDRPYGSILTMLMLVCGMVHVLSFAAIWSAATGYFSPSVPNFIMLDNDWVNITSDNLRICWVWDSQRTAGTVLDAYNGLILGPHFQTLFQSFAQNRQSEWPRYDRNESSPAFDALYAYAWTRAAITNVVSHQHYDLSCFTNNTLRWGDFERCERSTTNVRADGLELSECATNWCEFHNNTSFPLHMDGWQLTGLKDVDEGNIEGPTFKYQERWFRNMTFILDVGLQPDYSWQRSLTNIPFNSTIRYNGTDIKLDAPLLELGKDCAWPHGSTLGECVCYKGRPLTMDLRSDTQHLLCVNGDGYAWGFSNFLMCVGLGLEAVWALLCLCIWFPTEKKSRLISHNRVSNGALRNALDLAEAVNLQLGTMTSAYTDKELRRELDKCPPAGYTLIPSQEGMLNQAHIALISIPSNLQTVRRRYIKLDFETKYG